MNFTYAEYFLGIGAPGKAIQRVTKRHSDTCEFVYGFEIDKYARNAFSAIHGVDEDKVYHDITDQPNELPEVDVVFYSPPCQTFSLAGKREGTTVDKGNLFYNALEGIKKSNPKFCIMENVANLRNQFVDDFTDMIQALDDIGYISYNKVLNSKNYGIPQNRERIFVVSIRKDIYEQGHRFEFPLEVPLRLRLKDILEDEVNEKYCLSEKIIKGFIKHKERHQQKGNGFKFEPKSEADIASTLQTTAGSRPTDNFIKVKQIGNCSESESFNGNPQTGKVYGTDELSPTLSTIQGGGQEPKILIKSATKDGYEIAKAYDSVNLEYPSSQTRRARVGNKVAHTLTTSCNQGVVEPDIRIRKLTPLECFRLQGFDDEDYYKAVQAYDKKWKSGASDSQMYKRAGNSITVNVEEELLENLLYQRKQKGNQTSMF